jgi:hypothetical protein
MCTAMCSVVTVHSGHCCRRFTCATYAIQFLLPLAHSPAVVMTGIALRDLTVVRTPTGGGVAPATA